MRTYSDELKASLVERMLLLENASVPRLSRETGIPRDTLYGWRRQAWRERGLASAPLANRAERWRSEEKFAMVVETAALNEAQLGEYCRKRGVYPEEVKAWRLVCERAHDGGAVQRSPRHAEAQANKRRIRELEGELRRKEKALAEAATLLVLRKKAQAIWGEGEAV
jgi:transposase-like protein